MSWRFKKRLRIIPGFLWINLSKKGPSSLSVGRRGATMNISPRGHQETIGVPGSGISYRTRRRRFRTPGGNPRAVVGSRVSAAQIAAVVLVIAALLWILAHAH